MEPFAMIVLIVGVLFGVFFFSLFCSRKPLDYRGIFRRAHQHH